MASKSLFVAIGASALLAFAQVASAHPGHGGAGGFSAGVYHPLSGIDHILAMIAVGLFAAQFRGRAIWLLPVTFMMCMIAGGAVAMGRAPVSNMDQAIAASVLILGLLVIAGSRVAMPVSVALVALFGMFHGYAHGAEMRAGLSPAAFALGFVLTTATLHATGLALGMLSRREKLTSVIRFAGSGIAVCGLVLFWT